MRSHRKPSAKKSDDDTRKLLQPSEEVQKKMHPITRGAFDGLLRKAATPLSQKPASKHH